MLASLAVSLIVLIAIGIYAIFRKDSELKAFGFLILFAIVTVVLFVIAMFNASSLHF